MAATSTTIDRVGLVVIGGRQPPQRIGRASDRRATGRPGRGPTRAGGAGAKDGAGVEPGAAGVLGIDAVHAGEDYQEQADTKGDGSDDDGQANGRLFSPVEGETQAEAHHDWTRSADKELALPSRTMTSRPA